MNKSTGRSMSIVDRQLDIYIPRLTATQKKALLGVAKSYLEPRQENDLFKDRADAAEINRRFKDMDSGKIEQFSLDQAEAYARRSYKSAKRRK